MIARGRCAGVGAYLYFNEPLAVPADAPFWASHVDIKGVEQPATVHEGHSFALCTSAPLVQDFLRARRADLLARLDGLAGVILITASEFQTHCYSHHVLRHFEAIDPAAVTALAPSPNMIFMAGMQVRLNRRRSPDLGDECLVPALVAERYAGSAWWSFPRGTSTRRAGARRWGHGIRRDGTGRGVRPIGLGRERFSSIFRRTAARR